jgi:hypothetical protein
MLSEKEEWKKEVIEVNYVPQTTSPKPHYVPQTTGILKTNLYGGIPKRCDP